MSLYKMELYKICHKKILWVIGELMIVWMCFYFFAEMVGSEQTMYENETYYGYEAIQKDREITKEYEGILTDDDVNEIIGKYGFPTEVEENVGWKNINYLTEFITDNLSDGYIQEWDEYQLPTRIIPLRNSQLKDYVQNGQEGIPFAYAKGWIKFYDFCDLGVELILVWLIIALAPLFCEERQQKMYPLIFTSEYGKTKDIGAKVVAAFSIASIVYLFFMISSLIIFQKVFGILDVNMPTGLVLNYSGFSNITTKSIQQFLVNSGFTSWVAIIMMTAISIWVSSAEKTAFASVLISLIIFSVPVVLHIILGSSLIYLFASGQPFLLVNHMCLIETWGLHGFHVIFAYVVIIAGIVCGSREWRKVELC